MKIVHICMCGPVTDNWSYQDNILPKYHKYSGLDVTVITSKYIWNSDGKQVLDDREVYSNEYGIKTVRLANKYGTTIKSKLKIYSNFYDTLAKESPDILFIHGIQFVNIRDVIKYVKRRTNVKVYADNHSDFSNSASNWLSKNIQHKLFWKYWAQKLNPYVTKFYGVLPARVDFLVDMYKLPKEKVELLVMGADDEKVELSNTVEIRKQIREKHQIADDDFLIVTGGKIDAWKKQTLLLMEAVKEIPNNKVKLIVFGSVTDDLKEKVNSLCLEDKVKYIGWISSDESYKYFAVADLLVFPGRHSVFWEQAAGQGIPMIVKYWDGTTHVDMGENCKFLRNDDKNEIKEMLLEITNSEDAYKKMKKSAIDGRRNFLYSEISKRSIQE